MTERAVLLCLDTFSVCLTRQIPPPTLYTISILPHNLTTARYLTLHTVLNFSISSHYRCCLFFLPARFVLHRVLRCGLFLLSVASGFSQCVYTCYRYRANASTFLSISQYYFTIQLLCTRLYIAPVSARTFKARPP